MGCNGYDLPKRLFPKCDQVSVQLNTEGKLLAVDFALVSENTPIDKVDWYFGDGKHVTTTNLETKHTYINPGTYKVNVNVTNRCGDVVTVTKDLVVENVVIPTVVTEDPISITSSSATVRMAVNSNGNGLISSYGICFSATTNTPTIESATVVRNLGNSKDNTPVTFSLENLLPNKVYYIRAFATNSAGTGYGNIKIVHTKGLPSVTALEVVSISRTEAAINLRLNEAGNPPATHVGFLFSSSVSNPTLRTNDKLYTQIPATPIGVTTPIKQNLEPNTSYFYRAFAISFTDTVYTDVSRLTTQGENIALGLAAHYPLNNSVVDNSGNRRNGQAFGASPTNDRCGQQNRAYAFDGINDFITIPYTPSNLTSYTFSAWVYVADPNQSKAAISQFRGIERTLDNPAKSFSLYFDKDENDNNSFKLNFGLDGDYILRSKKVPYSSFLNQWVHIVAIWQGGANSPVDPGQMKLYFNGNQVSGTIFKDSEKPINAPISGTSTIRLGHHQVWDRYFKGSIDDVRIYERALSDAEIMQLWQQEKNCL